MGAPGLTSPIRTEAFKKLQLNAGIFLENFDYSSIADATAMKTAIAAAVADGSTILGVTRGGGSFTVTREIRTPEVDGTRYPFKGQDFIDSIDAYLSGTLLEATPDNFRRMLGTADVDVSGKKTTITMHTAVDVDSDYIPKLCWIGDLADGRLVLIELDNAFNTSDFSLTFTDKGEGTMTFEFHARQENVSDYDEAPFRVVFLETSGTSAALTVSSAAGSAVGQTAITIGGSYTPPAGAHYIYKVGNSTAAPVIGYHETPDYTWTGWDGTSALALGTDANGNKITIAVIDTNTKVIASGNTTLVIKTT